MDTPTYNAEGQAVWKPQPGEYWPGGLRYVQSYGGIISALQDLQASKSDTVKAYPNNFAGIIAAIEDLQKYLTEGTLPDVGAPPPGWEIIVDPDGNIDGNWQKPPPDGSLWFDTRQGRLFIAIDKQYYQTNGGDGLAHVGPNPPVNPPVIGSQWLETETGLYYVYIGEGQWQAVVSDGDITLTTATLPLAIARTTATDLYEAQILPELPTIDQMQVQKDYNTWLMGALVSLDKAITEGSVSISETPPTDNVVAGTLWYDSNTLELSIYYVDDDSEQWVPVSVGYALEEALRPMELRLNEEIETRKKNIQSLTESIAAFDQIDNARIDELSVKLTNAESKIETLEGIEPPDLSGFVLSGVTEQLETRIKSLEDNPPDLSGFANTADVTEVAQQVAALDLLTLDDVLAVIPDISGKVEQADIDASISNITNDFLPRNGGTIDGSFIVNKSDISLPAFDVSSSWYNSQQLFKLSAYAPVSNNTTFGATDEWWQYAWKFAADEEFAWMHNDSTKVFSITKDGPACSKLYLGQFRQNDSNGRSIANTIEVGEQLVKYQNAFEQIRSAVSTSSDFDSLKAGLLLALSQV